MPATHSYLLPLKAATPTIPLFRLLLPGSVLPQHPLVSSSLSSSFLLLHDLCVGRSVRGAAATMSSCEAVALGREAAEAATPGPGLGVRFHSADGFSVYNTGAS